MSENVKQLEKNHTKNKEETPLSIIYVRKKMRKTIRNLSTVHDVNNKRRKKSFKHNKLKIFTYANQQLKSYVNKDQRSFTNPKKIFSMPVLNYIQNEYKTVSNAKSWDDSFYSNTYPFKSNFLVYLISKTQYENLKRPYLDYNFSLKPCWKIYRCQLNTNEESCCCSCNSDAMFEVMKSLYDCYKKKNCDNCNCILCGHLPREERRLGELRKSGVSLTLTKVEEKKRKKSKQKIKRRISSPLEGKNIKEKEQVLKNLITSGKPLPEPKTKSDKELIKKVKTEYGYPQEVKKIIGEDLLKAELPELTFDSKKIPADKLHKLKEAGLLTPLEGKSSEQKEKILTELAINGIPLPKGKSTSDKKLIDKIRKDVGLPPEPKTSSDKKKYDEAMALGFITPLLRKSASDKEKILKGQADLGLSLPEGRTASEKKIIAKIKTTKSEPLSLKTPSAKLHKSKAEDILTPLKDKTSKEKENIIKDIAMKGIPLPEAKNASEKRLIDKVRAEVGLPPQPKTSSSKEKYTKAMAAGLITPLEGKTDTEKKKILKEQAKLGVALPEGRTPSEKALIAKVKTEIKAPSEIVALTERPKSKKVVGLITSLHGKTPEQKETILRDFAMHNVPFPEAKTASEKRIIDKVRKDIGLPPEPKSKNEKSKYNQAIAAGLITPLEGKPQSQKERILQGQADLGLQLPEGRSASEKALIKKIKSMKKKSLKPHEKTLVEGILPPDKRKKLDAKTLKILKEGKGPSDECICDLISPESEKIKKQSKTLLPRKKPSEKPRATKTGDIQSPLQREKIIRELVKQGAQLPEAKTVSEKKILEKVQADLGLPPVPTTPSLKEKYTIAQKAGAIVPLEGKTQSQKENILTKQAEMGITLPEGRSPSEKALINKIRSTVKPELISSEKLRKAKEAGLFTPLKGKSQEEKKRILRKIVKAGLPLPEGKTPSEKHFIKKVKDDIGLPSKGVASETFRKAKAAGLLTPLEDKTQAQKEKILRDRVAIGLPLPEGVTPSDKELIKKIKTSTGYTSPKISSVKHKKATGLLTTLEGKTPSQKEKIFEQQMAAGLPLPEAKSTSEKEIIKKIQAKKSLELSPLQGKTPSQKEKLLRNIAKQGLSLPEPKTLSEKALINKVQAEILPEMKPLSAKLRLAKSAGLLTPLEGKTLEQKEKILKGLTKAGIPLPEGKSSSEKKIIEKVREEVGLPPEPKTSLMKNKMKQAQLAGIITPLEGKSPTEKEKILKKMHEAGIPLPKGRTVSEKSLVKKIKADVLTKPHKDKVPSVKKEKAKAAGLLTPLEGKTFAQKEKIIRGLAKSGLPLPEGKTPSEKALINKIKAETGPTLSPEKIQKIDKKTAKVIKESKGPSDECICGLLTPMSDTLLELKKPSDKAYRAPSEKLRKTKTVDLLGLIGKTPEQIEKSLKNLALQGIPLPEARTTSEKKLIKKIRADVGLPPEPRSPSLKEKYNKAMAAGFIAPLQGKSDAQKEKILRGQAQIGLLLPDGRTPSEKDLIAKIKETTPAAKVHISSEKAPKAKISDLRMSLDGKSPEQKDKILRNLAFQGIPFPEAKTSSEKKLMEKVRADVGLPPEPRTPSLKEKYNTAMAAGYIAPLQGKSDAQKEKNLRAQAQIGLPLPDGRTPSEKDLITKIKATTPPLAKVHISSEKVPKAKISELRMSLDGKSPEQKNKILRNLALRGIPFPEAKTSSEKKLMENVRADVGLPPEPKTPSLKEKYNKAMAAGFIAPLQGKSDAQKEKILRGQAQIGLPLPDGRTPSEKDLITKIKATTPAKAKIHISSEKVPKTKISDLRISLHGKSPEQKNKILRNLASQGIPFPEAKTSSEKKLMEKVRADVGLPPEPKTPSLKEKYNKAMAAGFIAPLQGKSDAQKEKILRGQAQIGLPLPDGRTPSEKDLITKIKATTPPLAKVHISSEKVPKAKISELRMSLDGKSPEQKDKILRNFALQGIPFPEAKTSSEKKLMEKVRADVGLPPEPKTRQEREKFESAVAAGIVTPLQGKSASQKEKILRGQAEMGLNLPKARTSSEKALIDKIRTTIPIMREPTEKIQKVQVPSLLTPLEGKTSKQKEKILKGLVMQGISLPEPKSGSEKKLIDKVRAEVGLPPEPKTASLKEKYAKAQAEGLISPLQGKTAIQKEKILRGQAELGLPLPEGRTASEKALINKIKEIPPKTKPELVMPPKKLAKLDKKTTKLMKERKGPSDECICHILSPKIEREPIVTSAIKALSKKSTEIYKIPSEKLRKAKDAGLLTPLQGKSSSQKEKILKGLAMQGIPLPEAKTVSEKKLIDKVRSEIGLPPEPKTKSARNIYNKAIADGYITPLQGKSEAQKEKKLRKQAELRLPLPEGRTPSEKKLIAKIKQSVPPPSEALLKSEIMAKAKATGLLTPLEGKPFEKKEKIVRNLAEAGLPLPEGKSPSEKALIQKIKTEYGKHPKARILPEKAVFKKSKPEGLLKISPEASLLEKEGKIKTKSRKIGVASARRDGEHVGLFKSKGAITEEFQDVIKTTTCDRGCGCDKKKIRFKHSYVKIRVTSPDISSLCPCPEECVPGVKGGIFTDNEGIKVTVGRVIGAPSFSSKKSFNSDINVNMYETYFKPSYITLSTTNFISGEKSVATPYGCHVIKHYSHTTITNSKSETEINIQKRYKINSSQNNSKNHSNSYNNIIESVTVKNMQVFKDNMSNSILSQDFIVTDTSNNTSFESIILFNTDLSVSLVTLPDSISVISFSTTESSPSSSFCEIKKKLHGYDVITNPGLSEYQKSTNSLSTAESIRNNSFERNERYSDEISQIATHFENYTKHDVLVFGINNSKTCNLTELNNFNKTESNIFFNKLHNGFGIHQLLCPILSRRQMYDTSSLIIVISTSSDEHTSKYSLNSLSSTIGIDLLEKYRNWNYKANSLHHLHQNQRGFKLTTTGRTLKRNISAMLDNRPKITNMQYRKEIEETDFVMEKNNERKQQTLKTKGNNCRIISTDTTQDRPCCCVVKEDKLHVSSDIYQGRIDNVTELLTPIILKEADAQGLGPEPKVNSSRNNLICHPKLVISHSNLGVTSDRRSKACYCRSTQICDSRKMSLNDIISSNILNTCDCDPNKLIELFDKRTKKMISKACNISKDELFVKSGTHKQIISEAPTSKNELCENCGSLDRGEKNLSRAIKLREKQLKHLCPCEQQKFSIENYIEDQVNDNKTTYSRYRCQCKDNKHYKKNIICECPVDTEPEIDFNEWIDEKQMRKLKSDLTQTISGFKINKPRKKDENTDFEMSFEEVLKYIAENLEDENSKYNNEVCSCVGTVGLKSKNVSVDCECPYELFTPHTQTEQTFEEEPLKGIKFHISGKGSGSKGLNGILCFELLNNLSKQIKIQHQDDKIFI